MSDKPTRPFRFADARAASRRRPSARTRAAARIHAALEALEDRRLMATDWGAFPRLLGQDAAVANYPLVTGEGTAVAVIDTGVDWHHPALGNGFGPGYKVVAGWDFVDNDADPMDSDGHGTGIAGLIAGNTYYYNGLKYQGIAPNSKIVALRTDDGTFGYNKEAPYIEQALQWVIAHRDQYNIVAVNMSFGKSHYSSPTQLAPVDDELATLNAMGVMLVASSGNDGVTSPYGVEYPAADPNVYGAGSINVSDAISTFTERGPGMDILAPGEYMPMPFYLPATNQRIILGTGYGTSFAVPFICATAALLRQIDSSLTPAEMMSIMQRSGVANYDGDNESGTTTGMTWQRLQVDAALAMAYAERDDAYEPNDSFAAARSLSFTNDVASAQDLSLLLGDADYYKFTLGTTADVDFAISSTAPSTPGVDLLDSNGTLIKHLSAADAARLAAGTYFLKLVAPAATLDGFYGLTLTRTPDDALNNHTVQTAAPITLSADGDGVSGAVSGSTLLSGIDDYFRFTLDGTSDLDLAVVYGGASPVPAASLLDGNGNLVAAYASDGTLARRLAAGTYVVRIGSAQNLDGTYGLDVYAIPFVVPGANGSASGIAYDAAGRLHFAWYDEASESLKYAVRAADGTWGRVALVDPAPGAGQFVSVGLDSGGLPGLAYYDAGTADLKYAHFDGAAWAVFTADSQYTTGYYPSLKFDNSDRPVIAYYYRTGGDLRLAVGDSAAPSAWTVTTIDSAYDVGRYPSLALNPGTGRWAVAYENTTTGQFKYAEQTKSSWAPAFADATTRGGGGFISLAFNPGTNRPAMSYYDAYNADLKYAAFDGTKWVAAAVATKGSVGLYSNLRIDADTGEADILYFSKTADAVVRAHRSGNSWAFNVLTASGAGGRWINRAVDPTDGTETLSYVSGGEIEFLDL